MLTEPNPSEFTTVKLRAYFQLDALAVQPYAERPNCSRCHLKVTGRSYSHFPNGVICHACLWGRTPSLAKSPIRTGLKQRSDRWKNYVRPTHKCADCGKQVSEKRAARCRSCATKHRYKMQG